MIELIKFEINGKKTRIFLIKGKIITLPSRYIYHLICNNSKSFKSTRSICRLLLEFLNDLVVTSQLSSAKELEDELKSLSLAAVNSRITSNTKLFRVIHEFLKYCETMEGVKLKFQLDDLLTE